jgi:cell division protein FtsZ
VASLGGGVGSGAGPVFAKIAKSSGAITLGVFTLPFKFEGEKKQEIARESLQKLRPYLNAVVILPNDRIFQIVDKDTPLREALSCINKTLADSLEGLIETIYLPGLINIDFADLKTIMQGRGRFTYLNTIEVQGKDKTLEAVKKVLNCPLYPYTIRGAKGILFNITGEKGISLSEVSQISKMISELANSEAKIIFGISQSREYQDKIKVALLATACDAKILSEKARPVRKHRFSTGAKKPRKIKKKKSRKKALPKPQKKRKKPGKKAKSKARKIKIKVEREEALPTNRGEKPEQEAEVSPAILPNEGTIDGSIRKEFFGGLRVRKTGLQIRKEAEEAEKEFLEKEKVWEPPAFLRQQQNK